MNTARAISEGAAELNAKRQKAETDLARIEAELPILRDGPVVTNAEILAAKGQVGVVFFLSLLCLKFANGLSYVMQARFRKVHIFEKVVLQKALEFNAAVGQTHR